MGTHIIRLILIVSLVGLFALSLVMIVRSEYVSNIIENFRIDSAKKREIVEVESEYRIQKTRLKTANLARDDTRMFYLSTAGIIAILLTLCGVPWFVSHRKTLRDKYHAKVAIAKIGDDSEIPVNVADLHEFLPVAINLSLAKINTHITQATMESNRHLADMFSTTTHYVSQIMQKRTEAIHESDVHQIALPESQLHVPTFTDLLQRGDLAYGKPMILGYEHGAPRRGSFLDIYSAAVAGESGSGKTSTMLFLIGSGVVCEHVRFLGIDPHYPHPNSLGFKTKPLWEAGLMQMATFKDDMIKVLSMIEQTIDNRLQQIDTDTTPMVLVIDELAFLSKSSIGANIMHTMERISTEGRKCQVYMLASSQTWLVERTGGNSVVRDTLTSAYVHRIKPKQANLLLQDRDEADKVKRYVKKAGEVLFLPVNDESRVVQMPYTTENDMDRVVEMMKAEDVTLPEIATQEEPKALSGDPNLLTPEMIKETILKRFSTQAEFARTVDISPSLLTKILSGERALTSELAAKIAQISQPPRALTTH